MRCIVTGGSRFVGPMTDDKTGEIRHIESGKLTILVRRNTAGNKREGQRDQHAFGYAEEELRGVPPDVIASIEGTRCPFVADVETERVSGGVGKPSRELVVAVRPVGSLVIEQSPAAAVKPAAAPVRAA